jgi:hypothetical protein
MIQPAQETEAATQSELLSGQLSRSDMRLVGQAIRHGWNIPPELMDKLPEAMARVVVEGKPRDKIGAAKVLVQMHAMNAADKPKPPSVVAHAHVHRVENSESPADVSSTTSNRRAALAARIARLR